MKTWRIGFACVAVTGILSSALVRVDAQSAVTALTHHYDNARLGADAVGDRS